jgi:hypothetical protein
MWIDGGHVHALATWAVKLPGIATAASIARLTDMMARAGELRKDFIYRLICTFRLPGFDKMTIRYDHGNT